jgi:hypothetical protein
VVKRSTEDWRRDVRTAPDRRPGRHALAAGLAASVLLHVLLAVLDPSFEADRGAAAGPPPDAEEDAGRLIQLRVSESPLTEAEPVRVAPLTRPPTLRPPPTVAVPGVEGGARARGPTDATAAERLQYRAGPIWAPAPVIYETYEECVQREHAERLARGVAAAESAGVPIAGAPRPPAGGGGIGIRIPVGPKPLPWGQFERAPLPDTIRADATAVGRDTRRPATGLVRRAPGCTDTIPSITPRIRRP